MFIEYVCNTRKCYLKSLELVDGDEKDVDDGRLRMLIQDIEIHMMECPVVGVWQTERNRM